MKKLRRLNSRIDINQESYGEHENRSKPRDAPYNLTRTDSRKNLNNLRAKPSGLIGKICATFHKSYQKKCVDLEPGVASIKKYGDSESPVRSLKKAKGDDRIESVRNDKTRVTSTTKDGFFANDSLQILRCQDGNKKFLRAARDSIASSPRSPNHKSTKKIHDRPESCVKRKKRTLCQTTGCKSVKSKVEVKEAATDVNVDLEELIVKIKELKKNVQDLETAKRNAPSLKKKVAGEHVSCQTDERFITDIYGAQELLDSCNNNLLRIRKFLGSRKCQKLIEQHRKKPCCDEKLSHLHSLLDGLEVIVKFPNEKTVPDKLHVPADPLAAKCTDDQPEKHRDGKVHEGKTNEANKLDEVKRTQDSGCSTVCTPETTIPGNSKNPSKITAKDKSARTNFPKSVSKKNGDVKEKPEASKNGKKHLEMKTENPPNNPVPNESNQNSLNN